MLCNILQLWGMPKITQTPAALLPSACSHAVGTTTKEEAATIATTSTHTA